MSCHYLKFLIEMKRKRFFVVFDLFILLVHVPKFSDKNLTDITFDALFFVLKLTTAANNKSGKYAFRYS